MRLFLPALVFFLTLAGCAQVYSPPPPNWSAPTPPAMQVNVIRDDFQKTSRYEGPNCATKSHSLLFLRAVHVDGEASGAMSYVIYVSDGYSGREWILYDNAYDDQGHKLPLHLINRTVDYCDAYSCMYAEDFAIKIPKEYLLQHEGGGMRLQLSSSRGSTVYELPGGYIKAFLAQVP